MVWVAIHHYKMEEHSHKSVKIRVIELEGGSVKYDLTWLSLISDDRKPWLICYEIDLEVTLTHPNNVNPVLAADTAIAMSRRSRIDGAT